MLIVLYRTERDHLRITAKIRKRVNLSRLGSEFTDVSTTKPGPDLGSDSRGRLPMVRGLQLDTGLRTGPLSGLMHVLGRRYEQRIPMTTDDRTRIIQVLYPEGMKFGPFARRFTLLESVAVAIAVFGLVSDSTAVVIGAMLVAPLLTPVLGLGAAVIMGWPRRVVRYLVIVAMASAGSIALSYGMGLLMRLELDPIPGELLARTAPNLLDLGIAVSAGTAGAFAIVRRQAGDAMSGAAVAVALVPPLSSVGILAQQGEIDLAVGALLLFLTNVAGVVMAGTITFIASGFVPGMQLLYGARSTIGRLRWIALAVVVVVLPLQLDQPGLISPAPAFGDVEAIIDDWIAVSGMSEAIEVVDLVVDVDNGEVAIDLVLAASKAPPPPDALAESLSADLNRKVTLAIKSVPSQSTSASADADG